MTPGGRAACLGLAWTERPRLDYAAVLETPIPGAGRRLGLVVRDECLLAIDLLGEAAPLRDPCAGSVAAEVARQLAGYFADPTFRFDLPMRTGGTPYRRRVWEALARLPSGSTQTYGGLAATVGGSARSVGGACRSNPIPIVIPCHRVVAAHGAGGYLGAGAGDPVTVKRWLLAHEEAGG